MRALGKTQKNILNSLERHGSWHGRGCGWVWDTHAGTERVLETLVKRGLVNKSDNGVYTLVEEK